jgi:hypothetical protein
LLKYIRAFQNDETAHATNLVGDQFVRKIFESCLTAGRFEPSRTKILGVGLVFGVTRHAIVTSPTAAQV